MKIHNDNIGIDNKDTRQYYYLYYDNHNITLKSYFLIITNSTSSS